MKQRVLHIASLLLLMALAFQCMVSCVYDELGDDDNGNTMLVIRAASLDSRSSSPEVEQLHSLRVIILHANGTLEHNKPVSGLSLDVGQQYERSFTVSRNETKKIYLVANEESIPGLTEKLNGLGGKPAQTLEDITFDVIPQSATGNPVFTDGIPMSACYEVTVGNESNIEKDFYLVRAMTKFTISFENNRTDAVTLKEMKIEAFADKTYLFPQFVDDNVKVYSENFMVDSLGKYASEGGNFWIDWLAEAVEKSQSDKYTPDSIGWISNYKLPQGAIHTNANTLITPDFSTPVRIEPSKSWEYPTAFYRSESMNDGGYAISKLVVRASGDDKDKEWTKEQAAVLKLDQVKYLFRHTHVKVNVVFGQKDVVIYARIHPWIVNKATEPLPLEPEE